MLALMHSRFMLVFSLITIVSARVLVTYAIRLLTFVLGFMRWWCERIRPDFGFLFFSFSQFEIRLGTSWINSERKYKIQKMSFLRSNNAIAKFLTECRISISSDIYDLLLLSDQTNTPLTYNEYDGCDIWVELSLCYHWVILVCAHVFKHEFKYVFNARESLSMI